MSAALFGPDEARARRARLMGVGLSQPDELKLKVRRLEMANESLRREIEIARQRERLAANKAKGTTIVFRGREALDLVCSVSGVSAEDVQSPSQDPKHVKARQLVAWLARYFAETAYVPIGRLLSRDHTTVMDSFRRVQRVVELLSQRPDQDIPEAWAVALWNAHWPTPAAVRKIAP